MKSVLMERTEVKVRLYCRGYLYGRMELFIPKALAFPFYTFVYKICLVSCNL